MKLRLVYHLYVPSGNFGDHMKIHFKCLMNYSHLFDEALFVLSMENPYDTKRVIEVEHLILDLGFNNNVTFKVKKTNEYREGQTLKEEVADKIDKLDGLTFFAHSKGNSNKNSIGHQENLEYWITSMYYFNLNYIDYIKNYIFEGFGVAYGFLKFENFELLENIFHYTFSGSFYWINTQRLKQFLECFADDKFHMPYLTDRFYAENFLGNILITEKAVSLHKTISYWDDYSDVIGHIRNIVGKEEYDSYINFHNKIISAAKL